MRSSLAGSSCNEARRARPDGRRLGVAERAVGARGCGWTVPGIFSGAADLDAGAAVPGVRRALDRREVDGGEIAERFPVEDKLTYGLVHCSSYSVRWAVLDGYGRLLIRKCRPGANWDRVQPSPIVGTTGIYLR